MLSQSPSTPAQQRAAAPSEAPAVVPVVVQQHAEESAHLRHVRSVLVRAPHVGLLHLGRLDERIAAHLDGLAVAGDHGTKLCLAALERPGCGEVFALSVRALETQDTALLDHVLALVPVLPEAARGVASALGWVSATTLQGVARELLRSTQPERQALGLAACRMHQVDPGRGLLDALAAEHPKVRAAAVRTAGELGRVDLLDHARQALTDDHPDVKFQAAVAACLLGDRQDSLQVLEAAAQHHKPRGDQATALVLAASRFEEASAITRSFSPQAQASTQPRPSAHLQKRRLIRALGLLGDTRFVPWLIERMAEPELARLSGEAFAWITGADLARMDLATLQAPALPKHPSDDPDDDDVSLDDDESLPWPDPSKIKAWWQTQQASMPQGTRCFMGQPVNRAHALHVLKTGTQRQRWLAATHLALMHPQAPLFNCAAPTWRQERLLAATS